MPAPLPLPIVTCNLGTAPLEVGKVVMLRFAAHDGKSDIWEEILVTGIIDSDCFSVKTSDKSHFVHSLSHVLDVKTVDSLRGLPTTMRASRLSFTRMQISYNARDV